MTGSTPFLIEESDNFKRSFKKLAKALGNDFVERVAEVLENLIEDQYPINSRKEFYLDSTVSPWSCRTSI